MIRQEHGQPYSRAMGVAHWDDARKRGRQIGHLNATWTFLGEAAACVGVGVRRLELEPGGWSTPAHEHGREEEIFYVLAGRGLSWQDGETFEIGTGDCVLYRAARVAHTMHALDSLDVLAFGPRVYDESVGFPRIGLSLVGGRAVDSVEGIVVGSVSTGLQHVEVPPGKLAVPLHCHSLEEEIFVVLDGEGVLLLGDEETPVRPGHVVARPPATRVAHSFRAGDGGLTYLAYGTRERNDICYYPRSNKISWRGVGMIGRVETLDYWDGED